MPGQVDHITVRYWAAARSAAGVESDTLAVTGEVTLAEVHRRAVELHPDARFGDVLAMCSVLIGDRPAGKGDPETIPVPPGSTVEFLPPFAGG